MIIKNYKNNVSLRDYLEYNIKPMGIDDVYKPMLVDILLRRAYEYQLSPKEIQQDVISLWDSLSKIEVKECRNKTALGQYNVRRKAISISPKAVEKARYGNDLRTLYETLTHEVYHALSRDKNGNDRLSPRPNKITGNYNFALKEAIIERASDRTVYDRVGEETAPYYHPYCQGYSSTTFIVDVLCATYGVSEKDFLKNAIMGRDKLVAFLAPYARESFWETEHFLDQIETSLTRMHNVLYLNKKPRGDDVIELKDAMSSIANLAEAKMSTIIEKNEYTDFGYAYNLINNFKFNHNKLMMVINAECNALDKTASKGTHGIRDYVNMEIAQAGNRKSALQKINCLRQVADNSMWKIDPYIVSKMLEQAKKGSLMVYDPIRGSELIVQHDDPTDTYVIPEDVLYYYYNEDFKESCWEYPYVCAPLLQVRETKLEQMKQRILGFIAPNNENNGTSYSQTSQSNEFDRRISVKKSTVVADCENKKTGTTNSGTQNTQTNDEREL